MTDTARNIAWFICWSMACVLAAARPAAALDCAPHHGSAGSIIRKVNTFIGGPTARPVSRNDLCAAPVGRIEDGVLSGTGSLVLHPQLVVTSAHVVADQEETKDRVTFEFRDARGAHVRRPGTVVRVGALRVGSVFSKLGTFYEDDWALIVLDEPVPGVTPLALWIGTPAELIDKKATLFLIGYSRLSRIPGAGTAFPTISEGCEATGHSNGLIHHNCATMPGGSGSPIMSVRNGYCTLMALHKAGAGGQSREDDTNDPANHNGAVMTSQFKEAVLFALNELKRGQTARQLKINLNKRNNFYD